MSEETYHIAGSVDRPAVFVRRRPRPGAPAVLYIHGATFPSGLSVAFDFGGGSWVDDWHERGYDAWAFDFAGFGESGRYPEMYEPANQHPPLGRAVSAASQVVAVLELMAEVTGRQSASVVAHSWGSMPAGLAATSAPERVERLILFGPIAQRPGAPVSVAQPAWVDVTSEAQHARFVEDVPASHAPVLHGFDRWAPAYLASDQDAILRQPPAVRIPAGPMGDIRAAWSGALPWKPDRITCPIAIVRGEWDSLCRDPDARMILDAATSSGERRDVKLEAGTHLMHLETGRRRLYEAVGRFLSP